MKAILEFSLKNELEDFELAMSAPKYACALSDMKDYFREQMKHNPDQRSESDLNVVEDLRKKFFSILEDREIHLSKL